jgi:glycosyltransferase involved in cell wall biosynthesis
VKILKNDTVTIGIPSYNEGKNIIRLIQLIRREKKNNNLNIIEVIISDDSDDDTPKIVKDYINKSKHDFRILYIHHNKRRGQAEAWNEIFKEAKGKYILLLDADIVIERDCIYHMVRRISKNKKIGLVAGRTECSPENNIASIASHVISKWLHILRETYPQSQYTTMGRVILIRSTLAKKIKIPKGIISDDLYLQCMAYKHGYKVAYEKRAIIYFKPTKNIKEFISQGIRGYIGHKQLNNYINNYIPTKLPIKKQISIFVKMATNIGYKKLFITILAYLIGTIFIPITWRGSINYIWEVAKSTK